MAEEQAAGSSSDEDKWPAVDAAFTFVIPSYQWMLSRMEASDSRLQAMQLFVLTVTTGVPAVAIKGSLTGPSLHSYALLAAVLLGVVAILAGMAARSATKVKLLDPAVLYERWLWKSDQEFKRGLLYFSAQSFAENAAALEHKQRVLVSMTVLFAAELVALGLWFAGF